MPQSIFDGETNILYCLPVTCDTNANNRAMKINCSFLDDNDVDDADDNGELDFDFIARTRRNEGEPAANNLRSATAPRGAGPLIFHTK